MSVVVQTQTSFFDTSRTGEHGSIAIRVVVLPPKDKKESATVAVADNLEGEILPETGTTPVSSYLEKQKGGKGSCVFLVNGQRQDSLDNTFIIQELGFKYLRNRMMIMIDVDGLLPKALGKLMQGSRQGFYKGDVWDEIIKRVVGTLKDDPELLRLEEEAEEKVSELRAGDEKVKNTLDQLIDAHHQWADHSVSGIGQAGSSEVSDDLGLKTVTTGGVVSLLSTTAGESAEYPVLTSQPGSSSVRLRPDHPRSITVSSQPSNAWPALASILVTKGDEVPELIIAEERLSDFARFDLTFREPADFDQDQYPLKTKLSVTARFNGVSDPRQLTLNVIIKPDSPPPEIELHEEPTWIHVTSRLPVRIAKRESDTHVRLRWNGQDEIVNGPRADWHFSARCLTSEAESPAMTFSAPRNGRFSLLITPKAEWTISQELKFEVCAFGPENKNLSATFDAVVVAPPNPQPPEEKQPRRIQSSFASGSARRPPYQLVYITRDDYETDTCWGNTTWTDEDAGCFQEPTERTPLTLIINEDMEALRNYRRYLTRSYMESEVTRRTNKYASHIAFHLYQMYLAQNDSLRISPREIDPGTVDIDQINSREIHRVAMTLLKLMEVSR